MKYQYEVQIASLLHDIGKFYNKASMKKGKLAGVEVSGKHPIVGQDFIKNYGKLFKNAGLDVEVISEMVLRHHSNPKYDLPLTQDADKKYVSYCNIVNVADSLSSANDRDTNAKKLPGHSEYRPLVSVYGTLSDKKVFVKMSTNTEVYDETNQEDNEQRKLDTVNLIQRFGNELEQIQDENITDPKELYHKLYDIMKKYTRCVNPATDYESSDASLFDHSSTTSALASCIHKNLYSGDKDEFSYTKFSDVPSNIGILKINLRFNNYLQINRKGEDRAKLFVGKSLNAQNTLNGIINDILEMTELTISNILASSSTECYILIPNCVLEDVKAYLANKNKELFNSSASQMWLDFSLGNFKFPTKKETVSFYDNVHNSREYKGLNELFVKNNKWDLSAFENTYEVTKNTRRCLYCGRLTESDICNDCSKALSKVENTLDSNFSILHFKDFNYNSYIIDGFKGDSDKSTISRVATYMRLNSDFFGEEIGELLRKHFKSANVLIHNIDSCYVTCSSNETYRIADTVLQAYKEYTGNTMRLTCAIKEYKKSSKIIDFVSDCKSLSDKLNSKGYEVNVGTMLFRHRDTSINLTSYMNMLNEIDKIVSNGSSRALIYKVAGYINELILYKNTMDASHLVSLSLLTKESRRAYNPSEIKLIEEVIKEAKGLVTTGKAGRLGIYKEAINRTLRSKED